MAGLENGMLVQHASLGVGKIVSVDAKAVHVFFATSTTRFATKLRLPMSFPLLAPAPAPNDWLSALSGFALDAKSGRFARAGTWLSHDEAVARFVEGFPKAFADPTYLEEGKPPQGRTWRWRKAHALFEETLGGGQGERLLAADDVAGLVERAVRVERLVRAQHKDGKEGRSSFEPRLKDPAAARAFFAALFELLAAGRPDQARFEALATAAAATSAAAAPDESAWGFVTLLPFVARPDFHMPLRPRSTCEAAHRLGLDLAFDPQPNWKTYSALLAAAGVLLERLRPLGAKDHVDVDAFMHLAVVRQPAPAKPAPAEPDVQAVA